MIAYLRREYTFWRARRRLEKLITQRLSSFEHWDYQRRRAAALKATRG